ncbi:MAG TPA: hypothetical protein VFQ86_11095, partial [Arachidicoccus soli]|nr:hypothetical protein [Arachidicoccus soli]
RRALDLGKITKVEFFEYYNALKIDELFNKMNSNGGNYYLSAPYRVGRSFAYHIENAVKSGQLLYRDAFKLTGMSGRTFDKFFTKLHEIK